MIEGQFDSGQTLQFMDGVLHWTNSRPPSSVIDRTTGTMFGNYNVGEGAGAFDGVTNQARANGASKGSAASNNMYIGKTYGVPTAIESMTLYGSNDQGYVNSGNPSVTLSIYGKNGVAPTSGTDGTLLGSVTFTDTGNQNIARPITSTDPETYWTHVWVHLTQANNAGVYIAEVIMEGWQ